MNTRLYKYQLNLVAALFSVTFLSGAFLFSTPTSADDTIIDDVIITVPVACTLTGTGMNSHTATIDPGTTNSSIGETVLKAYCNDNGGFAIYAIGYSNQSYGNNKLLYTVNGTPEDPTSSSQNNHNISTGLNTTGNPSSWAMKLTSVSDTSTNFPITIQSDTEGTFANFHTVPDTYKLVAKRTEATDVGSEAIGSILKTTYQAHIASLQKAGTYEGKVKYTLVHPNNTDAPLPLECNPSGTTIGTGTSTDIVCMQDVNLINKSDIISSMTQEQQYQLIDSRDGKSYTVARLADYNIWMTQNLDLDLDSSKTYTNEDTDVGFNTETGIYETASWTPERSTYQYDNPTWGLYNENTGEYEGEWRPESYDMGDVYWNGGLIEDEWYDYLNSCTSSPIPDYGVGADCNESLNPFPDLIDFSGSPDAIPQYHLGNYYNWTAAVAMNDASAVGQEVVLNQSICPSGWTLPNPYPGTNEDYGSLTYMLAQYGWTDSNQTLDNDQQLWDAPFYFPLAGQYAGETIPFYVGYLGQYWSSMTSHLGDSRPVRFLKIEGYNISAKEHGTTLIGNSVRCVARWPTGL